MIVTCPACSSRYKLDESKVTARGAKITCPKCKHVFVVYPGGTTGPIPDAAGDSPKASKPPNLASSMAAALEHGAPIDNEWDDEPTRIGMQKVPDLRRPSNPTLAIPIEPPPFQITSAEAAARSPTLDFKKVGVSTWKVKIKIGLIYDFSDIKTLRKYIQDGRVTNQDVISYDGKIWRGLSEIPDLDVFFVQTWEELNRLKMAEPAEHVAAPPKKVAVEETPARVEPPKPAGPTTSPFRDPFAQKAPPKKVPPPTKKPAPATGGNSTAAIGVLILVLVLGAGWWFTMGPGATPAAPPPKSAAAPAAKPGQTDDVVQNLKSKLQPVSAPTPAVAPPPEDPSADNDGDGRPDNAVAVRPTNLPAGATPLHNTQPSTSLTTTAPAAQRPVTPTQTTTAGQHDMTAAEAAAAGDDSARRSDWSGAVSAYGQAVSLDGQSASYHYKLGNAQLHAGQSDQAAVTLQEATKLGSKDAWKLLGQIAKDNGDPSGASSYYQKYLDTKPKDAADIEKILQSLQGG